MTDSTNSKSGNPSGLRNSLEEWEVRYNQQAEQLETAFNRRGKYAVKLSNVGNPDHRQDPRRKLPETTCAWAYADTLAECSALCLLYISFYDLGGGNWSGGKIVENRREIGRVYYNGRVVDMDGKEIL